MITLWSFSASSSAVDDEAEAAFQTGTACFHNGEFEDAAAAFRRAHTLRPNWKLLYNIGQSSAAAKQYGPALEAFERYLVLGGDEIDPGRRDEVLEEMGKFRKIVGAVEIDAPDGLVIVIDDLERGQTPLAGPLLIAGGIEHRLKALRDGSVVFEKTIRVIGEERTQLTISEPTTPVSSAGTSGDEVAGGTASPSSDSPEKTAEASHASGLKIAGWTLAGVGAGTLIAGAITGGMALSLDSDLSPVCTDGGCPSEKSADRDKMERLALSTDILIGVGSAVAVTGIVLVVVGALSGKKHGESTNVAIVPQLYPGIAAISFRREF